MERISEGGLQWESGWMEKLLLVDPTNPLITDILSKYDPDNNGMFITTQLLGIVIIDNNVLYSYACKPNS